MQKIISIIGPTATGKSALALQFIKVLEEKFAGVSIVSADSRQVYRGMELGTGADVPADFSRQHAQPYDFWQSGTTRLYGLSMISPRDEWSVAHFQKMAQQILSESDAENRAVIFVGGTGLYHQQLFNTDPLLNVPPNEELRLQAASKTVAELQDWLAKKNPEKLAAMNNSDRQNPRRLIRAIELADDPSTSINQSEPSTATVTTIGLTAPLDFLAAKIAARIDERLRLGMREEVQHLIADFSEKEWHDLPAFSATGYKEVRAYLEEKIDLDQLKELWLRRELQYAKRQLTWWKKRDGVTWFDVSEEEELARANAFAHDILKS